MSKDIVITLHLLMHATLVHVYKTQIYIPFVYVESQTTFHISNAMGEVCVCELQTKVLSI